MTQIKQFLKGYAAGLVAWYYCICDHLENRTWEKLTKIALAVIDVMKNGMWVTF